jgi:iron complex outermembrane receptor protein
MVAVSAKSGSVRLRTVEPDVPKTIRYEDRGVAMRKFHAALSVAAVSFVPLGTGAACAQSTQDQNKQSAQDQKKTPETAIVVTGKRNTTTATKTDTPLIETPQAISVIPKEIIQLRDDQRVKEALQLTAGVQVDKAGADTRYDEVSIRGFSSTEFGDYRDGLRQPSLFALYHRSEPYGLESIEILKGPSSVLFGQNAPGGLVNVISKQPTPGMVNEVVGEYGSWNHWEGKFDLGGSLIPDDALLFRVVGVGRSASTFLKGYAPDDRIYLEPSVKGKIGGTTTVTVRGEYLRDRSVAQFLYFQLPDGTVTNVRTYEPKYDKFRPIQKQIGYTIEHDFSDAVKFKQNLRYSKLDLDYKTVGAYGLAPDNRTILRLAYRAIGASKTFAVDNQLQGHFNLGEVETRLLAGVDYLNLKGHQDLYFGFNVPTLDLIDPVYGADVPDQPLLFNENENDHQLGGYAQGQFKYRGTILTANGRYDHAVSSVAIVGPAAKQTENKFTYRLALAHLFENGLAPYVSYGTSFQLTPGTNFAGSAFKPTTGKQLEGGIKYSPNAFPGFITATVYQITQQNVLTQDPDPNHAGFSVQTGEIRSRGVELEGSVRPVRGLNLQASYTYLDQKITKSNLALEQGKVPPATPKNKLTFLADYTFREGALHGFGLGGDVRYEAGSWQDQANTLRNPSNTYIDTFLHYDISRFRLSLTAHNLFDRRGAICSFGFCYPQMPRDVLGSIAVRF